MSRQSLVIGSRGSALAMWQAQYIASRLADCGVQTRIEVIRTTGDHLQTASLVQTGGKGLFTKEIEDALLAGTIDLAVHSLKDLPTDTPSGLMIAAIPEREDPRDCLVGHSLPSLPTEARVGTSSLRRSSQLLHVRPDLQILPIRGNVDTRLRKLKEGEFDAILLAAAGLHRLGLANEIGEVLDSSVMCCAPGQGALAIETRATGDACDLCASLNHPPTSCCVTAERAFLAGLGGGCQLPIAAFAEIHDNQLELTGVVASPDGKKVFRDKAHGSTSRAKELGVELAHRLTAQGASSLLTAL